MMTNEEKLELAEKCGAVFGVKHILDIPKEGIFFSSKDEFFACTSAIEEKYQAQTAILWNALRKLLDDTQHNDHDCGDGDCPVLVAKEALTATQQSSDAFIAEVKARARKEYRDELLPLMVTRFLQWKLPKNFSPDAGISFNPEYNKEYMASLGKPPTRHEPFGTNLFDAEQAKGMVAFMLGGISDEQVDDMVGKLRDSFNAAELRNEQEGRDGK